MEWIVPGTALKIRREEAERIEDIFSALFLAGGIAMAQVSVITGLEAYTVQNWVKRGLLSPPQGKKYTLRQLCRIININMLKGVLPMERICGMLSYINGHLDDESDDIIDDSQLYFMFVRLAARARELQHRKDREDLLEIYLTDYEEPVPGAKERVRAVLNIMLTAWLAARMQQLAENLLDELNYETVKENENGTERNLPLVTP